MDYTSFCQEIFLKEEEKRLDFLRGELTRHAHPQVLYFLYCNAVCIKNRV